MHGPLLIHLNARSLRRTGACAWWWLMACAWPLLAMLLWLMPAAAARAEEPECVACHKVLHSDKDGHAALKGGCKACHATTNGEPATHGKVADASNGLASTQPALCVACHNKGKYTAANAHSKPAKGCSGCHTTHASGQAKLLKLKANALCFECHDRKLVQGKVKHDSAARGACLDCHDAHSAEQPAMLTGALVEVCVECHGGVKEQPHVLNSFSGKGHPLGDEKELANTMDALRPGQRFSCTSCHDPHKGDRPNLVRYDTAQPLDFCQRCHEK